MSQHALRAANESFYRVFESLDFERMQALWARSVQVSCVHPGWDLITGFDAVMQSWKTVFEGTGPMRFRVEDAVITAGREHGWVVCREILSTDVQGVPVENLLLAVNTFVLEQGQWRISHHHTAPLLAGKPRSVRPPETLLH